MTICGSSPTPSTRPAMPVKNRAMKTGTVEARQPIRMAKMNR